MQLCPNPDRREEFESWVGEGRVALAGLLSSSMLDGVARQSVREQAAAQPPPPTSFMSPSFNAYLSDDPEQAKAIHRHAARGADMKACEVSLHTPAQAAEQRFHWIHVPATEEDRPDTVAIVFTHKRDLEEWRVSAERESWLQRGAALARREREPLLKATSAFQLTRDDGSLGGWLPAGGLGGGGGAHGGGGGEGGDAQPPPPAWRISATVLLAMYPMQVLIPPSPVGAYTQA